MIAAVAFLLQLAASAPPPTAPPALAVRAGTAEKMVPLAQTNLGPAIAVEALAPVIPVQIANAQRGHFRVSVAGFEIIARDQLPFVSIDGQLHQLAGAPYVAGGRLHLPFHLLSEVLPRLAPERLRYDARRAELRLLGGDAQLAGAAAPRGGAPAGGSVANAPTAARSPTPAPPRNGPRRVYRVVVDAGHGGHDPGTSGPLGPGPKTSEKTITLAVALEVERLLRTRGVEVIMTRRSDVFVPLAERGRIANNAKGDVFVSIHVNGPNPRWRNAAQVRGFETFFLSAARTEDEARVAAMENESMRFETEEAYDNSDPLAWIMRDMAQNEHLRESSELAELMQRHMARTHPGPNRGVKQAGFAVLVRPYMPSVLVELGFLSNAEEARWMNSAAGRRHLAAAIVDATMEYLDHYDRRLGTATR